MMRKNRSVFAILVILGAMIMFPRILVQAAIVNHREDRNLRHNTFNMTRESRSSGGKGSHSNNNEFLMNMTRSSSKGSSSSRDELDCIPIYPTPAPTKGKGKGSNSRNQFNRTEYPTLSASPTSVSKSKSTKGKSGIGAEYPTVSSAPSPLNGESSRGRGAAKSSKNGKGSTATPSFFCSEAPSTLPTAALTNTLVPTTIAPTILAPTTLAPSTQTPTDSVAPSKGPTNQPTMAPSSAPSLAPTSETTFQPTSSPSRASSSPPSELPTTSPTQNPTIAPTMAPSLSQSPTDATTQNPSVTPSLVPTESSTVSSFPSSVPTQNPTTVPTMTPTLSQSPTAAQPETPSATPSLVPTDLPTVSSFPSSMPTARGNVTLSDVMFLSDGGVGSQRRRRDQTSASVVDATGASQPVNNIQPFTGINYIIALQGIYPSRNRRLGQDEKDMSAMTTTMDEGHLHNSTTERQLQAGVDPLLGQITMFGGNFAPRGWAFCDGQLLAVSSNDALFSLLGTFYGGDGRTTFALPDLRGRVPIHMGQGPGLSPRNIGSRGGQETVVYSQNNNPVHNHAPPDVADLTPFEAEVSTPSSSPRQVIAGGITAVDPVVVGNRGGNQAVNNMQPFTTINFSIALQGNFPSRNRMLDAKEDESERPATQAHRKLAEPCLAFVSLFAFNFPPRGFTTLDGAILPINSNQALYSLLGTTYGGDGRTNFVLPDLRGRTPMHADNSLLGARVGQETTAMTVDQMPFHSHQFSMDRVDPFSGNITDAEPPFTDLLNEDVNFDVVPGSPVSPTARAGNGSPITNLQPSLGLNYIIALEGIFPSRSRRLDETRESPRAEDNENSFSAHRGLSASDVYIGEITLFAGNFAPRNWAFCNGQLRPIASNTALFAILGTSFGGDGRSTFALPNLNYVATAGRTGMGSGIGPGLSNRQLGEMGGFHETVLSLGNLGSHSHSIDLGGELEMILSTSD